MAELCLNIRLWWPSRQKKMLVEALAHHLDECCEPPGTCLVAADLCDAFGVKSGDIEAAYREQWKDWES